MRSIANMTCYFENPAATAETVDAAGWLRIGDAGSVEEDGFLYLHGAGGLLLTVSGATR